MLENEIKYNELGLKCSKYCEVSLSGLAFTIKLPTI